jgi:hypothetical protein
MRQTSYNRSIDYDYRFDNFKLFVLLSIILPCCFLHSISFYFFTLFLISSPYFTLLLFPGIFTGHAAIELYAEAFESVNALDKLEPFLSFFGQKFYKIKRNARRIRLTKESWSVPMEYTFGSSVVRPLRAGESIGWTFKTIN